jgi:RES domain
VRQRDLLAAVARIDPIRVQGTFERHTSLRWEELKPSAAGGRWGARRAYEVLYLGRPRSSVVIEAYRHLVDDELDDTGALAASVLERRIVTCKIDVPKVLDLRKSATRAALSLADAQLSSEVGDYTACQAIGAAAHQLGLAGLIAPAASRRGETLALFPANLPVERWPRVTKRDIWRGLPPDPRHLRLVDEA